MGPVNVEGGENNWLVGWFLSGQIIETPQTKAEAELGSSRFVKVQV